MTPSNAQIDLSMLYLVTHPHPNWFARVTWLIGEGVPFVQIRDKDAAPSDLLKQSERVLNFIDQRGLSTTVVLNDNVQIAKELGIGVHLGQSDMLPEDARAILGSTVPIGWTIHDNISLIASQEAHIQYVGVGPIFPSTTKLDTKPQLSLSRLEAVCKQSSVPVVAIGGINASNIHRVRQVKPWRIAMSSALMNATSLRGFCF